MFLTAELIDLKLDLNAFMCETSNKCEVSYYDLVKTLNSTNFIVSAPLRAAFVPLNITMNNIQTDSMSDAEVNTFLRFKNQLRSVFDSTIMYIERYSMSMIGQMSPVSMLMQQMTSHVSMYMSTFAMAVERNPSCARPLFPKWIPSLQIIQDTCLEIVESSIQNFPDKYASTFEAVDEAVTFLESLQNKFTFCAGSASVGQCISNWITSSFECSGCSTAYEPLINVMTNHSMGVNNITMTSYMEMNGMQYLIQSNEVMNATRTCVSPEL